MPRTISMMAIMILSLIEAPVYLALMREESCFATLVARSFSASSDARCNLRGLDFIIHSPFIDLGHILLARICPAFTIFLALALALQVHQPLRLLQVLPLLQVLQVLQVLPLLQVLPSLPVLEVGLIDCSQSAQKSIGT